MPTASVNQSTATPPTRLMQPASEAVNPAPTQPMVGNLSDGIVTIDPGGITSGTALYTCLDCGAHFCRELGAPLAHVCAITEVCPIADTYEHSRWWAR